MVIVRLRSATRWRFISRTEHRIPLHQDRAVRATFKCGEARLGKGSPAPVKRWDEEGLTERAIGWTATYEITVVVEDNALR